MRWSLVRALTVFVAGSGVVAGFIVNVDRATRQGQDLGLVLANYFSLFTVVSAILTVVVLTAAIVWTARNRDAAVEPFGIALGLALVTGPVLLLGIVFNVLLRGDPSAEALADSAGIHFLDSWATETMHVALPLLLLLDLFAAPRRRALPWSTLVAIAVYPILWLGYTMVRGAVTPAPDGSDPRWYPYPFLDPDGPAGWTGVLIYVVVMLAVLIGLGAGVVAIGRYRARRRVAVASPSNRDALEVR